jgi:hypothetical protein
MRATLNDQVVAESDEVGAGYKVFPRLLHAAGSSAEGHRGPRQTSPVRTHPMS